MAKRSSSGGLLKTLLQLVAVILLLSAFDVTLSDITSLDWFGTVGEMLVNFFTN